MVFTTRFAGTPTAAYQARPKAAPGGSDSQPQARIRRDIIDTGGTLTLRHNGRLHHIGVGRFYPDARSTPPS